MTRITPVLLLALGLAACGGNDNQPLVQGARTEKDKTPKKAKAPYVPEVVAGYEGYYTGMLQSDPDSYTEGDNLVTVRIDSVRGDRAWGQSVAAGNVRPLEGNVAPAPGGGYTLVLREPGTDKYDGTFHATLSGDTLQGRWEAFNKGLPHPERFYALGKKALRYDPKSTLPEWSEDSPLGMNPETLRGERLSAAVVTLNASTTLLRAKDVESLYKADLEVLRNTIYARHGYSFRNPRMRAFFTDLDWYMPVSNDVTAQLTELELKNIALLKRYEGHAEKYYDYFGR